MLCPGCGKDIGDLETCDVCSIEKTTKCFTLGWVALILFGAIVVFGLCVANYNTKHSPQATVDRFIALVEAKDYQGVISLLDTSGLNCDEAAIRAFVTWLSDPAKLAQVRDSLSAQAASVAGRPDLSGKFPPEGNWTFTREGFGPFNSYKIKVKAAQLDFFISGIGKHTLPGILQEPLTVDKIRELKDIKVLPGVYDYVFETGDKEAPSGTFKFRATLALEPGNKLVYYTPVRVLQRLKVNIVGDGRPYDVDLVMMGRSSSYMMSIIRDDSVVSSYPLAGYGRLQTVNLRGKEDILFVANAGSGNFVQEAKIFGYNGSSITCLLVVEMFSGQKGGRFEVENNMIVYHYMKMESGSRVDYMQRISWDAQGQKYVASDI